MKIVQNFGAGTQSVGLMLMALDGKFNSCPDDFVFADTGSEPDHVYEYFGMFKEYISKTYNREIEVITGYYGILHEQIEKIYLGDIDRISSLPLFTDTGGITRRNCTADYKIYPINRFIKEKYKIGRKKKDSIPIIEQWFGISLDEIWRCNTSQNWWTVFKYPLVEARMYRHEVINYVTKYHNLPEPPRSSCFFCPFHSDRYWKFLKDDYPDEFEKSIQIDIMIRQMPKLRSKTFLHNSRKPLNEVDLSDHGQTDMFDECYGYCGI